MYSLQIIVQGLGTCACENVFVNHTHESRYMSNHSVGLNTKNSNGKEHTKCVDINKDSFDGYQSARKNIENIIDSKMIGIPFLLNILFFFL